MNTVPLSRAEANLDPGIGVRGLQASARGFNPSLRTLRRTSRSPERTRVGVPHFT
jgi:hypothetical protein